LTCLPAVALVLQSGCATTVVPSVPSQAVRDSFGVVAIVPAQYAPQSKFAINWRHKEGATGKQAALMASGGTATSLAFAPVPGAGPVLALSGVIATAFMTAIDAVRTSRGIVPANTAAEIESAINKAVAALDVQNALAARLATILKSDPQIRLATVGAAGPEEPVMRPAYAQLRGAGIDTVIEVATTEIGFDGCIMNNWECRTPHTLHLFMHAQTRLVRVADGATLFEWPLDYKSGPHELSKWLADGGRVLGEEIELAYRELAERIYDQAFLITPIALPFTQAHCWLEPLYPEFEWFVGYRVDALRPTLRWTAFPREIDREKLDPSVQRNIGGVTYDLRIWDEDVDQRLDRPWNLQWRNRLFYERAGLAAPQHALEVPLAPASRYYWSVRARFVVDGRPMATRWMRRSGCFSDELFLGYFEFYTPK
jgi:hypothetical protein